MGEEGNNFIDIWGFGASSLAPDKTEDVEEVVVEVEADGAEKVAKETVPDGKPGEDLEVDKIDDKKQVVESEVVEEDALSQTQDEPTLEAEEVMYQEMMQGFVDNDILDLNDEEKEVDFSKEGLQTLIQETVEKKSTEAINTFKEGLGTDAKGLLDVLEKGGNVEDYVKMNQQIDFSNIALESSDGKDYQKNQSYLVEDWMKLQDYEQDEIDDTINDYIESGMLKKQATIAQKKLTKWQENENKSLLEGKEQALVEQAKAEKVAAVEFKDSVLETRDISGFQVTEGKAKKLYDFITKKDKEGKTSFDKTDTAENRMLYAYFAMEGFDKEKLSKDIASTQARTLKKKLSSFKDKTVSPKRGDKQVRREGQEAPSISWNM